MRVNIGFAGGGEANMSEQKQEEILRDISKQLDEVMNMLAKQEPQASHKIGRPTKEDIVMRYRRKYPDDSKTSCVRATGLSIKTVSKYWEWMG